MTTLYLEDEQAQQPLAMYLRVQSGASSSVSSELHSLAIALVKDVLATKLNVEADVSAPNFVHARGFNDAQRALVASRALQVSLEGFSHAAPGGPGVAVVLDSADDAGNRAGVSGRELVTSARPFQVLVTQRFFDRLEQSHLLPLRALPRTPGVFEFLWTSDQRLSELQRQNEPMPTVVMTASQLTSLDTRINETNFLQPDDRDDYRGAPVEEVNPRALGGLSSAIWEEPKQPGRGRRWLVAGIVAIIAAGLGYGGAVYTAPGQQIVKQLMVFINGPQTQPPPVRGIEDQKQQSSDQPQPPPPPLVPPHLPPKQVYVRCDVPKNLVPGQMDVANTYLRKGEYDDAFRAFRKLQGCDPAAKDGMQRARKALASK